MVYSVTRSSRSCNKKTVPASTDHIISKAKSSTLKKKKQRISKKDADLENRSKQQQQQPQSKQNDCSKIDASEHPEYIRLMNQLDQSKNERLQKVENWRNFELQSIHDWFTAQKKQAWDDFYFARKKVRSDLVNDVQQKITRLKQELAHFNKQSKTQLTEAQQEYDYVDWVPPERLYTIGSFVGGASNDEIDRDLAIARQPYNGTPNLVYSDYESRSTTHSAEDERAVSPARTEIASSSSVTSEQYHHPYTFEQANHSTSTTNYTTNTNNTIYPPYGFEQIPQERSRDWWPYRSTTIA